MMPPAPRRTPRPELLGRDWLDQVLRTKAPQTGGAVRRKIADATRVVGQDASEPEAQCGRDHVIFRTSDTLRVMC